MSFFLLYSDRVVSSTLVFCHIPHTPTTHPPPPTISSESPLIIQRQLRYKSGPLIDLCLDFFGKYGNPNVLAPSRGLPERERHRLGRFLTGIRVTTNNPKAQSSRPANPRVIKRLSTQGANTLRFNLKDGTTQTVAVSIRLFYP